MHRTPVAFGPVLHMRRSTIVQVLPETFQDAPPLVLTDPVPLIPNINDAGKPRAVRPLLILAVHELPVHPVRFGGVGVVVARREAVFRSIPISGHSLAEVTARAEAALKYAGGLRDKIYSKNRHSSLCLL